MPEADLVPDADDRPSVARLYDFLLGGHHNYAADRELGRRLLRAEPNARRIVAENRAFLGRAVRFLLECGVYQFVDLGSGIPTQENVHEIARRFDPEARVVYVDNDQVAVAHSKHILSGDPLASVINADLRDPAKVLDHAEVRRLIDFSRPVGVLMVAVLHFVPDEDDPAGLVRRFAQRLAAGSYVVISHVTHESQPDTASQVQDLYKSTSAAASTRSKDEIAGFFTGLDLVEPGLVYVPRWRPEGAAAQDAEKVWFYAGVGRKP
ncbi:MAG TPA: SAM-dependent methyltransferase [Streptosporangiaceae bacterium]|nr:SAM-dependent methyltransferase [Streptosporangiaceae bacterium]